VKFVIVVAILVVVLAVRRWVVRRGRARNEDVGQSAPHARVAGTRAIGDSLGDVGLVALREIRERVRGRIFRVGTIVILLAVGAAIIIPAIHSNTASHPQKVGVVGVSAAPLQPLIAKTAASVHTGVEVVGEPSSEAAERALRDGTLDIAVVGGDRVIVNAPVKAGASSTTSTLAEALATTLGIERAYRAAGLSVPQVQQLAHAAPVPVESLQPASKTPVKTTSVIGLVLLFLMLTQYNTWIMTGVMQEKASRVVEVLLATVRPLQLLGGKVLGIGLVAMGQAALIVGFALVVAAAVGSDLLHGTAPLVLVSELLWLVLGYAFYCWVYAAAGSMAERQDQIQTLALPLTLPIVVAYVLAITAASSGNASTFLKVLAYLPPTAPFAMPVLVGLRLVSWWQFLLSVLLALAGTVVVALLAERIYRRAVLRSGQRVRLHDLVERRRRSAGTASGPGALPAR
jgi:ABC-2 type transport system permease protein